MRYIGEIVFYVHNFICKALVHVCPDERVRASLWSVLQEHLLEQYQKAVAHVKFIIQVERYSTPLTASFKSPADEKSRGIWIAAAKELQEPANENVEIFWPEVA
jgi:hypothetical protein